MSSVTESLKGVAGRKVLGVPFPVAAGVVVVGTVAYGYIKKRNASAAPSAPDSGSSVNTGVQDNIGSTGAFSASPVLTSSGAADTNDTWSRRAIDWLMVNKRLGAGNAQQVVNDYLQGSQLSFQNGQYRDAVVSAIGFPPTIPSGGSSLAGSPAIKQGAPPCAHIVQGSNDTTWLQLSYLYYGTGEAAQIANLQSANPGYSEPLSTGAVLQIPKSIVTSTPTTPITPSTVTNYGWFQANTTYTLDSIARTYKVSSSDIRSWNPGLGNTVYRGTWVKVRANAGPLAPGLKFGAKLK